MHVFISAGEPSGDLHGANLARALRTLDPNIQLTGLGGERMRDAGIELTYPLADCAVMGIVGALKFIPTMRRLLRQIRLNFARRRPDAVVLIDYPGFHWWLAAQTKNLGIPVVSFVPPQIWAWLSGRVKKVRAYFDHVLCALPFEESWYRERGVKNAHFIGHPYFDELSRQHLDQEFLRQRAAAAGTIIAVLPGSRNHEVRDNLPTMLNTARYIHARRPDARFLFPCFKEAHRTYIAQRIGDLTAELLVDRTAEAIEAADVSVACSGSVGLELLYRRKPTVVIYRTSRAYRRIAVPMLMKVPHVSIVNLLAGREIYPEFLIDYEEGAGPGDHVLRWLNDPAEKNRIVTELTQLKDIVAAPGACDRAAGFLVEKYGQGRVAA